MRHTISILVNNEFGILTRIISLFARRGFNFESLSFAPTEEKQIYRIMLVIMGNNLTIEQLKKQLYKLIDVQKVLNVSNGPNINCELMLIKVRLAKQTRSEILDIVDVFDAKVVDFAEESIMIALTGESSKIRALEQLLKKFNILELVKTGEIALVSSTNSKPKAI